VKRVNRKINWKLDRKKILTSVLTLILFVISGFYNIYQLKNQGYYCYGFPLDWMCTYEVTILTIKNFTTVTDYKFQNLILDIIFWFAISYLITHVYYKIIK